MEFFTADLYDNHAQDVHILDDDFKNYGALNKFYGQVQTISLDKNNHDLVALLKDEDGSGKVLIVDVQKEYFAVIGENLMKYAQANNWKCIIVNGYIRDTIQIKDIPVALFALGKCPRKYIPITKAIRDADLSFCGVQFSTDDWVYVDDDGIILSKTKLI